MIKELSEKLPEHEAIYRKISHAIMFGAFAPGQAVTLQGLCDRIGAGMMPVRDAVRRLTSEGALLRQGNRRIIVPVLTLADIEELAFARGTIEPKLAKMAIENSKINILSELQRRDASVNAALATGSVDQYMFDNYHFHFSLYEAANSQILLSLARSLWLRSGPSMRIVFGRMGTANMIDMHDVAIEAYRMRDKGRFVEAIAQDISQGIELLRRSVQLGAEENIC